MLYRTTRYASLGILVAALVILVGCGGGGSGATDAATQDAAVPGRPTVLGAGPRATPTPVPEAVTLAEVLALVAAAPSIKALPKDLTPALQNAKNDNGWNFKEPSPCHVGLKEVISPTCMDGDPGGSRTVVLLGDSHAAMWRTAFDQMGKRLHWRVIHLSKQSCGPFPGVSIIRGVSNGNVMTTIPYSECSQWLDYVVGRINQVNPDMLVLTCVCGSALEASGGYPQTTITNGFRNLLDLITASNVKKVVLGDTPPLSDQHTPDCLAAHEKDIQSCSTLGTRDGLAHSEPARSLGVPVGASYIDVIPWFCTATCTAVIGNMIVYIDASHISKTYASYLSGVLQSELQRIMEGR